MLSVAVPTYDRRLGGSVQTGNISSKVLLLIAFSMDDNADKNIATV